MCPLAPNTDSDIPDGFNTAFQQPIATAAFHSFSHFYIGWPTRRDTWRQSGTPACMAIEKFVLAILRNTVRVVVVVITSEKGDQIAVYERVSQILSQTERNRFRVTCIPCNDCWMQDIGPIFARTKEGKVVGVSFKFNAWGGANGGCYSDFDKDQKFATQLLRARQVTETKCDIIIEGGALSSDGYGTVLTTRECLLNENRNGVVNVRQLEITLRHTLGMRKVIWLPRGAAFDSDTDGHVDNIAVFIARGTVLLLWADAAVSPEQHARSRDALDVLQKARDADGRAMRVFLVDAPPPLRRTKEEAVTVEPGAKERAAGEVLCASYVNLVMIEDVAIAPKFGHREADEKAYRQLSVAFESVGKRVVQVDSREFILAGGGLHCISLGEPESI